MVFLKNKRFLCTVMICMAVLNCFSQEKKIIFLNGKSIHQSEFSSRIRQIMNDVNVPGLSIAVINNNDVVYHEVFGVSNTETRAPVTHPGIAPESQEDYKLITARMVLSHQTGFPNHANNQMIKLAFKPGTGFMYSGEAYQYLAAVVATLNGVGWKKDLNELFRKEVTLPLQMEHSTFVWDEYLQQHKVFGHDVQNKPTANHPRPGYWNGTTFNAYSSLHSEAGEYAKFIVAMLKHQGLNSETFYEMLSEQVHFKDDNPLKKEMGQTGWGLGFAQKRTAGYTMHLHTGNNHDFQAYTMFVPEKKFGIVLFTNCNKMQPFLERLAKVFGPLF